MLSFSSQDATPTLWDSLEEPHIMDTSEFEYLFSKDTTQQKKKPLSEAYEKKNKVKKVLCNHYCNCKHVGIHYILLVATLSPESDPSLEWQNNPVTLRDLGLLSWLSLLIL